jgi:hypothetical protein
MLSHVRLCATIVEETRAYIKCGSALPELRRFFRRRIRILYAGAGVTFSQLRQNDKKTIWNETNVKRLLVTANCQLLLMNSS